MQKLEQIDAAEAVMAVLGVHTIISRKVDRVTKAQLDRVDGLGREVATLARKVVRNQLSDPFRSVLKYHSLLNDLVKGIDVHQVEDMVDRFPAEYRTLGHAFMAHVQPVIKALVEMVPRSLYQTMSGATNLVPDDVRVFKFVSILQVLDNPLLVFPLMATGALLRSQAHAVRTLYPSLSAAIDAAILDATIKAKSKTKSFELSARAEVGVKAWMGQPPVTPEMLKATQAGIQREKAKQDERKAQTAKNPGGMTATQSQQANAAAPSG